jgi:hypothetical protein
VAVRSAAAHGVAPERAQLSVAELLGRNAPRPLRPSEPPTVPETWPLPVGPSRLRLARTAGAYLVAGSVVCAAAFGGHASDGPTMGTETADGGPPTGARIEAPEPSVPAEQPRTTASDRYATPTPPRIEPAARVRPAAPRPVRSFSAPRRRVPVEHRDRDTLRVPAGSALSSLTRPIVGSDSLLGPLG